MAISSGRRRAILAALSLAAIACLPIACGTSKSGGKKSTGEDPYDNASGDGEPFAPGDGATSSDAGGTGETPGDDDANGSDPQIDDHGFPSPELYLQIVGPSAQDYVSTGGGITYLAGILFGEADQIVWQSSTGQSGTAHGGRFWKTGPITLEPGDNSIVIKAVQFKPEDHSVILRESADSITVTYNPSFYFSTTPVLRPSSLFTGQTTSVSVTVGIGTKNFVPSSVTLWEVDEQGNTLGKIGQMVDSGDTGVPSCDEIQDDNVFSRCAEVQSDVPTMKRLRVTLQVSVEGSTYTVFSPVVPLEIVEPLTVSECESLHQVQKDAKALYESEAQNGNPDAAGAVVAMLKANPLVKKAGQNQGGRGIWTEYNNGILGALNLPAPGQRGAGDAPGGHGTEQAALVGNTVNIESKNVLALAPFKSEFGGEDEVPQIAQLLKDQVCPEFKVDGPHIGPAATLATLRGAFDYGILLFSGHADTYFDGVDAARKAELGWEHDGSQEVLWTGEPVQCEQLTSSMNSCSDTSQCGGNAECVITAATGASTTGVCVDYTQIDLRRGRVILGADTYGVHPHFFPKYAKREWPSSLAYLGACRTLYNGTLAGELFGVGAKAIAGFTDYVHSSFASSQAVAWFQKMLTDEVPTGAAALFPAVDPQSPDGQFRLFGGSNVLITDASILNAGFEKGDVTGWHVEGDGRVISQLGISIPVGGKFMGILSTGLGYTQQTGELSQSFCIPEGVQKVSFFWKFFSEEFTEWCGSIYQDTFQATLEGGSGQLSLVNVKVDDLCDGGSQYTGLIASDVSFDQGGVYNIPWQMYTKDVTALAGNGPVTLKLFATDQGDSIYDTVILVDSIQFE